MIDLLYLARDHDLPPAWDGMKTFWGDWEAQPQVFICPPPRKAAPCQVCGSVEPRVMSHGRVLDDDGRLLRLDASRCPDCRTDQVMDWNGDWWDLDPADYTHDGSRILR